MKLNFKRRLVVNLLYLLAFAVMFGIPIFFGIREVYKNIEFVPGNVLSLNWAVAGVLIMIVFAIIYLKYIRRLFFRKLQALQVRDELGMLPAKGIIGVIFDRFLRTLEYIYPFLITLLMLYVAKYMFGQYEVFEKFYDMNLLLIYLTCAGFGIFLVADFVKISFMQKQQIEDKLDTDARTTELEYKRLKKNSKKQKKALELERKLQSLKDEL